VRSYQSLADGSGWEAWRAHLLTRRLRPLGRLLGSAGSPLAWGLPADEPLQPTLELIERLAWLGQRARQSTAGLDKQAARWLAAAETADSALPFGLECLAWCWALPALVDHLDEQLWWRLLNHLTALAKEPEQPPDDPLARQLILGELPLVLAYWFGELANCRALADAGRRCVAGGMREATNARGVPQWRVLPSLRPLVACWTRCRALGNELHDGFAGPQLDRQYRGLVQHALRLSRADGRAVFAASGAPAWEPDLLKAATRLAGDETPKLARLTTIGRARPNGNKGLPRPAFENEWAAVAQLRSDWSRQSPQLTVVYGGQTVRLELGVGPHLVMSGAWECHVALGGQALEPIGDWEQTCWQSDEDVDYLELSIPCTRGVTLERHLLQLRQDRVLFLADAMLGNQGGKFEYRGRLPLAGGVRFEGQPDSREGTLTLGRKRLGRVLPLSLPEWRAEPGLGELHDRDGVLELEQSTHQPRMFAPLFLDLDPARIRRETTWRQLTVAEDRAIVPADVAVGYRVQAGDAQWMIYRSLAEPAIRSLLGKSLMHQFLFGDVPPTGRVETLLEIDSTSE
jgi:hypothetical protein